MTEHCADLQTLEDRSCTRTTHSLAEAPCREQLSSVNFSNNLLKTNRKAFEIYPPFDFLQIAVNSFLLLDRFIASKIYQNFLESLFQLIVNSSIFILLYSAATSISGCFFSESLFL